MSSPEPQSVPPTDPVKKTFAALTTLDWNKDRSLLMMAGGAVLAIVLLLLIPRGGADAKVQPENPAGSSPTQVLASTAAALRPDLAVTSVDGNAQTVTFKDKDGALSTFKLDPQTKTLVPVPAVPVNVPAEPEPSATEQSDAPLREMLPWIPAYPGSAPEIVSSSVTSEGETQIIAKFKSSDTPVRIVQFFQAQLQDSGFIIEAVSSGQPSGTIRAHDAGKKRMLILNVDAQEAGTLSRVVAVQKK